jgi:hypothetical protein
MKSSDLLLYGAVGLGAYFAWKNGLLSSLTSMFSNSSPSAPAAVPASSGMQVFAPGTTQLVTLPSVFTTPAHVIQPNPVVNPVDQVQSSSYTLGDIYTAIQYASAETGKFANPGQWNYWLAKVSNILPPDPSLVFPLMPNEQMTLETYWLGMAPWLAANKGLSGLSGWEV